MLRDHFFASIATAFGTGGFNSAAADDHRAGSRERPVA